MVTSDTTPDAEGASGAAVDDIGTETEAGVPKIPLATLGS